MKYFLEDILNFISFAANYNIHCDIIHLKY